MTPAELAAADQAAARRRDQDVRIRQLLWAFVVAFILLGAYGVAIGLGLLEPVPGSPLDGAR